MEAENVLEQSSEETTSGSLMAEDRGACGIFLVRFFIISLVSEGFIVLKDPFYSIQVAIKTGHSRELLDATINNPMIEQ